MHFELRHLRSIQAIHRIGGLALAAESLNMTQSALSHQIKGLEDQAGVPLFVRRSKPLKLSDAGMRLLKLAEHILPQVEAVQAEFTDLRQGKAGRLHIAIECHACFEWLFPVLEQFRQKWPDVDVDIRAGLAFDALPALEKEQVDVVISSDPEPLEDITFTPLFEYSPVFVAAASHPLAQKDFVVPQDFKNETLITYPVPPTRLDVFSQFLHPAKIEPAYVRQVELTAVILLLVASKRGVSVLPDWVLKEIKYSPEYVTKPLGEKGVTRRLYAATRNADLTLPYIKEFMHSSGALATALQNI